MEDVVDEEWEPIQKAIKQINAKGKLFSADNNAGRTRYASIEKGGKFVYHGNTACHAGLSYPGTEKPVCVVNQIQTIVPEEPAAIRFYEWLLNFSPYRDAFITKNAKKAVEDHIIIADTKAPANIMVGGLMASRFATEPDYGIARACTAWDRLVELGVHPNAAFALSHSLRVDEEYETIAIGELCHTALYTGMVREYNVHNYEYEDKGDGLDQTFWYLLKDMPQVLLPPYREHLTYSKISATWHGPLDKMPKTGLRNVMQDAMERSRAGVKKTSNPFAVAAAGTKTFKFNEALEEIALDIKNIIALDDQLAA